MRRGVLVTGASRGLGRAIARRFGEAGDRVAVGYQSDHVAAEETAEAVRSAGGEAVVLQADLAKPDEARRIVAEAASAWGGLDVLVNNAGTVRDKRLVNLEDADWDAVLAVNLSGAFWCLQAAAQIMVEQKRGAIVNIASRVGLRGNVGGGNYAASKGGLIAVTKTAAAELGPMGVRVNAVLPGFHLTRMASHLAPEKVEQYTRDSWLGRRGDERDVAEMVELVSRLESVTGQVLAADSRLL